MMLAQNQQAMKYSLYLTRIPTYETDENNKPIVSYITEEGQVIYAETGEDEPLYSVPKDFMANISMSGSEAEAKEYGLSISDYQAVLVYSKSSVPLVEGSLIWFNSPVKYEYGGEEIEVEVNGEMIKTKAPDRVSSDFSVIKISDSLNFTKAILKATNK